VDVLLEVGGGGRGVRRFGWGGLMVLLVREGGGGVWCWLCVCCVWWGEGGAPRSQDRSKTHIP